MTGPDVRSGITPSVTVFVLGAFAALLVSTFLRVLPGLDPESLWLDDLWVATLAKHPSVGEAVLTPAPAPPGFLFALWILRRLFTDPEWPLQLLPLLATLVLIVVTGVVSAGATGSRALGVTAGGLIAANPTLLSQTCAVKQFTTEALFTALFLALALRALPDVRPNAVGRMAALGLVAFFFSFYSLLASFLLIHLSVAVAVSSSTRRPRACLRILGIALLFDLAAGGVYLADVQARTRPVLQEYWTAHFLPTHSLTAALGFLAGPGLEAMKGALPRGLDAAVVLVVPGLGLLLLDPRRRAFGLFAALYLLALVVASGLHLYPMGGGRTDIFTYPVTVTLVVAGAAAVTRFLGARRLARGGLALAALAIAFTGPSAAYRDVEGAHAVRRLTALTRPDDGIVIYPAANWLVAYYGEWPYRIRRVGYWGTGFEARPTRPRTVVLPWSGVEGLGPPLRELLNAAPPRILYVASHARRGPQAFILDTIVRGGYRTREVFRYKRAHLRVFERRSPPEVASSVPRGAFAEEP